MNCNQAIALAIAAANIVVIMLFPPFDVYSIAAGQLPVFGGFDFYFNRNQYMVVNTSVLALEFMIVLVNTGIAILLLASRAPIVSPRRLSLQHMTLIVVALNLVVIVLFPPFQSVFAISKAALPTFEGFYFIFGHHSNLVIVTTILYLEVAFVLVNGALFWLIFHDRRYSAMSREQMYKTAQQMRRRDNV